MQELFSCRNCIHNAGQSLNVGSGSGYCMQHNSLILEPSDTTCKYQHRKDLPHFVVDESRSEHASEFAHFTALVSLSTHTPMSRVPYSERYSWERRQFDAVLNALANYPKVETRWIYIQAFAGGVDGQRALVHSCLTRRYMNNCSSWTSSYRMVLSVVDEMKVSPKFAKAALNVIDDEDISDVESEARWDVFFARLCGLQEYGWHAGIEELMWASDRMNGTLSELDWEGVVRELDIACDEWAETIIGHAKENDAFFSQGSDEPGPGEGRWGGAAP